MLSECQVVQVQELASDLRTLLESTGLPGLLPQTGRILIKPNLVNEMAPPVTTPVDLIRTLVELLRSWSRLPILIGEGCGTPDFETSELFTRHGYDDLCDFGVELIDLNHAPLVELKHPENRIFPTFYLPKVVFDSFLISVPVLKAHSLSGVTLAMKNLIGCAPPKHCQQGGYWRKSIFHARMQQSIVELNRIRRPDFSLIDARRAMIDYHLGGAQADPPPGLLIAGRDPVAVDAAGASALGVNWRSIGHIAGADAELGNAKSGEAAYKKMTGAAA